MRPGPRTVDLETLRLGVGSHAEGAGEMCVMEAVAYAAGEDWTDRPASVSPVIHQVLRSLNDSMRDGDRQALKWLIPVIQGSRGPDEVEGARAWAILDWHCRAWPSAWLRAAGCPQEALELEGAGVIRDAETLLAALGPLLTASGAARAKRIASGTNAIDEGFASALAACDADETHPVIEATRARIKRGDVGPAVRAARNEVPAAFGWDANRRALWTERWDAAVYAIAVASGTTQIAAVRALFASSAWSAGWIDLVRRAGESGALASQYAMSIGRDAALVATWNAAWATTNATGPQEQWAAATEAAEAAVQAPVNALQRDVIELIATLAGAVRAHVLG